MYSLYIDALSLRLCSDNDNCVQIMNKTDLPVEPYVIISNELNPY